MILLARSRAPSRALAGIGLGALLAVLLIWNGLKVWQMATTLEMADFGSFYRSASAYLDDRSMYDLPRQTLSTGHGTVTVEPMNLNPPHFHLLLLPLAMLPPGFALGLWALGSLASLAVSLRIALRESGLRLSVSGAVRGLAWLLAFVGTGTVLVTGQLSLLLLVPVTLAWAAARHGRWAQAGCWLGIASSVKPFLLIFIPYFLLRRRLGGVTAMGLSVLACFSLGVIVFGTDSYRQWFQQVAAVDWSWQSMNGSLRGALSRLLAETPYFVPLVVAPQLIQPLWVALAGAVGSVTLIAAAQDSSEAGVDRAFALILVAALLMSPLGWVYYLWLPMGPLLALGVRWWSKSRPVMHHLSAIAAWRDRLLMAATPGLVWPTFATLSLQPSGVATILPGSIYCWSMLALWAALVIDSAATWGSAREAP
jgi:alpha-1,2-mannosyltransferase